MKIKVINPNTSVEITREIDRAARKYARSDTNVFTVCPQYGPESIESFFDKYFAAPGLLQEVNRAVKEACDGIVIACFGDPVLDGAKEVADIPVVGIAEASMITAGMLGRKFSILTIFEGAEAHLREMVKRYGFAGKCASIRGKDIGIQRFITRRKEELPSLIELGKKIVEKDQGEVIILGCAGMTNLDEDLEAALGIPIIDPIVAAVKLLEGIIDWGKKPGKRFLRRPALRKKITGYPEYMQPFVEK